MIRPWVWGIDVSTKKLGVGLVSLQTFETHCVGIEWLVPGDGEGSSTTHRLMEMQDAMIRGFTPLLRQFPPCTIAVEEPMGSFHKRNLDTAYGITLLTLGRMAPLTTPWPTNLQSWKAWWRIQFPSQATPKQKLAVMRERLQPFFDVESFDVDELAGGAIAAFAADTWEPGFDRTLMHPQAKE